MPINQNVCRFIDGNTQINKQQNNYNNNKGRKCNKYLIGEFVFRFVSLVKHNKLNINIFWNKVCEKKHKKKYAVQHDVSLTGGPSKNENRDVYRWTLLKIFFFLTSRMFREKCNKNRRRWADIMEWMLVWYIRHTLRCNAVNWSLVHNTILPCHWLFSLFVLLLCAVMAISPYRLVNHTTNVTTTVVCLKTRLILRSNPYWILRVSPVVCMCAPKWHVIYF